MLFTDELLDILPPTVADKIRRLDAAGDHAELLASAIRHLDHDGAYVRFVRFGVKPAHVVVPSPVAVDHTDAVAEVRERLAKLDAIMIEVDSAHLTGGMSEANRELHLTDISLARLALERIEESIIAAAEDAGVSIQRRVDLDPAAFLEIERA